MEFTSEMRNHISKAPKEVQSLLADIMIDAILGSDYPEEAKIEVRLVKISKEIEDTVHEILEDFATPLPPYEEEGKEAQMRAFPARKQCLEYLELVKQGLDTFRQQVPAPDIPEKYKDDIRRHKSGR